ncbi:sigma-54 dependent transcriptional regulator [Botrimarina sp.]|uniref:sigma-54-dependent transcriptional regulator n=1 Tax=Botrimarina sp. TaxID=2795802 RepID=UPI0032EF7FDB
MPEILIVDDEESICWGLEKLGRSMGCGVRTAASAEEGLRMAAESPPDLLVIDVRLPGVDGLSALDEFRRLTDSAPAIVMTAFGALEVAVEAIHRGAFEYVLKPFDLQEMRAAMQRGLSLKGAVRLPDAPPPGGMVGESAVMQTLFKRIALAAASDANVLLTGESGVGKELAARAIHEHGARSAGPFVAVNAAALSPSVVESELFGHVEGAFTGANRPRPGLMVQADGGTLFLDEVAEIDAALQTKLLRAIEQGEVLPVGADRPAPTRFRVVAATHQDLPARIASGEFRRDLYYRLCVFEVRVPPLRERVDDIPLLAAHFATRASRRPLSFSPEAIDALRSRQWPGNVRELRNAVEHAAVLARWGVVLPEHLPSAKRLEPADGPTGLGAAVAARARQMLAAGDSAGRVYERLLREFEGPVLREALAHHDGEYAPAARTLGIHRTTLRRKLDGEQSPGSSD